MKIKIGNFNFINSKENKLSSFTINPYDLEYFYLDGNENTLFAESTYILDYIKEGNPAYDNENHKFEKELLEKYPKIINYTNFIKNKINEAIEKQANELYSSKNYSRYDLYNDITEDKICNFKDCKYSFENYNGIKLDFDNNRIIKDGFILNPYTLEIENLQQELESGRFSKNIKANLIKKEIEDKIAPNFVLKILEINEFIQDKKSVTVEATGLKPYKVLANLPHIIELRNNNITLETYGTDFDKQNPNVDRYESYNSELSALTYGSKIIQFSKGTFKNLEEQIATTPEDKFLFKVDKLQKEFDNEYRNFCYKIENEKYYSSTPLHIDSDINSVVRAEMRQEVMPEWYLDHQEEFDTFFEKYQALQKLKVCETISDIEEGLEAFPEDDELKQIIDDLDLDYDMGGYVFPKESEEEEESEDEPEM